MGSESGDEATAAMRGLCPCCKGRGVHTDGARCCHCQEKGWIEVTYGGLSDEELMKEIYDAQRSWQRDCERRYAQVQAREAAQRLEKGSGRHEA